MTKYCPTCPRSSDDTKFVGEFCEHCIIDGVSKSIPDTVQITICRICGKVRMARGFFPYTKSSVAEIIRRGLHSGCTVSAESIEKDRIAHVVFVCPVENTAESVRFSKPITMRFRKQTCMKCSRKRSGYYQAIVQLRGSKNDVLRMERKIDRFLTRRDSFITKAVELHSGKDLYVEDKNKMKLFFDIYKELKSKRTATLAGVKNGKRIYRHTYYVPLDQEKVQ